MGQLTINVPVAILLVGIPILSLYLHEELDFPFWIFFIGIVLGLTLSWLYWGIMITRWRIWAFSNVRNVHELKKRAIRARLIWDDASRFSKTEIRSRGQSIRLAQINEKFNTPDVYEDDLKVPKVKAIKYSMSQNIYELIMGIALLIFGIILIERDLNGGVVLGLIMSAIGLFLLVKQLGKFRDRKPHLILNNKGIETRQDGFVAWEDIYDISVVEEGYGSSIKSFILLSFGDSEYVKMNISDLDTKPRKIEYLIKIYKLRFEKENHRN